MFDYNMRWHVLMLVSPCGQCCIVAEFLPLIKVNVWVLVVVRCNYRWLIIETWVSLVKTSQTDLVLEHKQLCTVCSGIRGYFHSSPRNVIWASATQQLHWNWLLQQALLVKNVPVLWDLSNERLPYVLGWLDFVYSTVCTTVLPN